MQYKKLFLVLLMSLGTFWLAGCAGSSVKDDAAMAEKARLPAYFQDIPADTLVFAGGSEPIPRELLVSALNTAESYRALLSEEEAGEDAEILRFLVAEMGGKISAEGLEKLGISSSPRVAFYMVGYLPVLRIELSDKAKFISFLQRLEREYEVTPELRTHEERSYRAYQDQNSSDAVLVRLTDEEVIVSFQEEKSREIFLPYFLGLKKPEKSMADDNRFRRVVENNGFSHYAAAYMDMQQLAAWATGGFPTQTEGAPGINEQLLRSQNIPNNDDMSPACKTEYRKLAALAPRLVGGIRHYDATTFEVAVGTSLDPEFARQLKAAVSGVPGAETAFAQKSFFEIGVGLHVGKLLDFLDAQARKIQEAPFECEDLYELNEAAQNIRSSAGQVPPALRSLAGINILLRDLMVKWDATDRTTTVLMPRFLGAIRSDNPGALLYLAKMFLPHAMPAAEVKPDGEPVALEALSGIYEGLVEPFMLMTTQGIAVAGGPQMVDEARTVLAAPPAATAPALLIRLNVGDPVRELLANVTQLVEEAAAEADARGLTPEDIAGARRAVTSFAEVVPEGTTTYAMSLEVNPASALLAWRSQGGIDSSQGFAKLLEDENEADFEALGRVLGAQ